ncbi:hypothetical protein PHMEG_0009267 [Phytophthora megakarya]|uniref:Uncharacterized protein n=1 Tax=Phytophthora megakarya TaxID=4795 RepID=A0A225WJ39_9STRA|nr:hypothetical protein PHMEG_0009267 [Phytophthora megakarya]
MIEVNLDDRLLLAESTLRHAMMAVLGPRSVNESKFSSWETSLKVLACATSPLVYVHKKPFYQHVHVAVTRWPRFGRKKLTEAMTLDLS